MPEGGCVNEIPVRGMDADLANVVGVRQTDELPRIAAVDGFVNPVAIGDVSANGCLSHAGIDDVRIRIGDGDGADGG